MVLGNFFPPPRLDLILWHFLNDHGTHLLNTKPQSDEDTGHSLAGRSLHTPHQRRNAGRTGQTGGAGMLHSRAVVPCRRMPCLAT